jgi:hypothetical protein
MSFAVESKLPVSHCTAVVLWLVVKVSHDKHDTYLKEKEENQLIN